MNRAHHQVQQLPKINGHFWNDHLLRTNFTMLEDLWKRCNFVIPTTISQGGYIWLTGYVTEKVVWKFQLNEMCSFFIFSWISHSWSSLFGIKKGGNSNNFSFSVPWMLWLFVAAMQYKQSQEALVFFIVLFRLFSSLLLWYWNFYPLGGLPAESCFC